MTKCQASCGVRHALARSCVVLGALISFVSFAGRGNPVFDVSVYHVLDCSDAFEWTISLYFEGNLQSRLKEVFHHHHHHHYTVAHWVSTHLLLDTSQEREKEQILNKTAFLSFILPCQKNKIRNVHCRPTFTPS